eukprot:1946198-Prymnesium_polylepis.2
MSPSIPLPSLPTFCCSATYGRLDSSMSTRSPKYAFGNTAVDRLVWALIPLGARGQQILVLHHGVRPKADTGVDKLLLVRWVGEITLKHVNAVHEPLRILERLELHLVEHEHAFEPADGHACPLLHAAPAALLVRVRVDFDLLVVVNAVRRDDEEVLQHGRIDGKGRDGQLPELRVDLRDRHVVDPDEEGLLGNLVLDAHGLDAGHHGPVVPVVGIRLVNTQPLVRDEHRRELGRERKHVLIRVKRDDVTTLANLLVIQKLLVLLKLLERHKAYTEVHRRDTLRSGRQPLQLGLVVLLLRQQRRLVLFVELFPADVESAEENDANNRPQDGNDNGRSAISICDALDRTDVVCVGASRTRVETVAHAVRILGADDAAHSERSLVDTLVLSRSAFEILEGHLASRDEVGTVHQRQRHVLRRDRAGERHQKPVAADVTVHLQAHRGAVRLCDTDAQLGVLCKLGSTALEVSVKSDLRRGERKRSGWGDVFQRQASAGARTAGGRPKGQRHWAVDRIVPETELDLRVAQERGQTVLEEPGQLGAQAGRKLATQHVGSEPDLGYMRLGRVADHSVQALRPAAGAWVGSGQPASLDVPLVAGGCMVQVGESSNLGSRQRGGHLNSAAVSGVSRGTAADAVGAGAETAAELVGADAVAVLALEAVIASVAHAPSGAACTL